MNDIYSFVRGPLAWAAFVVFIGGSVYRLISMAILAKKKDPFVYSYMSLGYGLRSILHWIIPFGSHNMRRHPLVTIVGFAFHICLLVAPLFLLAHIMLWDESWNISWWSLSDSVADTMTLIVIAGCAFFLARRLMSPAVRFVTSASDYVLLAIVAVPFITGFLAYHQWINYKLMLIFHIIAGEVMLAAIPFTRLIHMVFFPFTRAYMGSEFGSVRHVKDW